MQFNYKLSAKKNSQSQLFSITRFCVKNKLILVSLVLCLLLYATFNLTTGIIVGFICFLVNWMYTLWKEISSLDIIGRIEDIAYEDLVEDLERGYGSYTEEK